MASLHRRQQTAAQLAAACGCSRQTILRHLKKAAPKAQFAAPQCANVVMDTTYFGRRFGIMVLFDSISDKALSVTEVKNETNALYAQAIGSLKAKGIEIQSIVCDGRYLTRNLQTAAGNELWRLVLSLTAAAEPILKAA